MPLTQEDRARGGRVSWEKYKRIPPGRKKLPRLTANTEERAARPRGGYQQTRRAKEVAAEFDYSGILIF